MKHIVYLQIKTWGMKNVVYLVILCVFAACKGSGEVVQDEVDSSLVFKVFQYNNSTGNCATGASSCFKIKYEYPEIETGSVDLKEKFNSEMAFILQERLLDFVMEEITYNNTEEIIEKLFADYEMMVQNAEEGEIESLANWFIEIKSEVLYHVDNLISLSVAHHSYTGGANPDRYILYRNYSLPEFKLLELKDVIKDPEKVLPIAEEIFRANFKIPIGVTYTDHGYWFENDVFYLPENFVLSSTGILFRFNPYEIGPYAIGELEFKLPYELIRDQLITQPVVQ
jgi:hypothetical protein